MGIRRFKQEMKNRKNKRDKRRKKIAMVKYKRVFIFWSLLIGLLLTSSFLIRLGKGLKSSEFNKQGRITLSFLSTDSSLIVFSFENKEGVFIKTYYEKQDSKDSLDNYLKENYLLFPSGNFYGSFPKLDLKTEDNGGFLRKALFGVLIGKAKTKLNRYDLLVIFVKSFHLKKTGRIYEDFKKIPSGVFNDSKVRAEALSLAILNASGQTGLAQKIADFLENNGARVIRIADSQESVSGCSIFFLKEDTYTLNWLKKVYSCQLFKEQEQNSRADITLIFGDNLH